MRLEEVAAGTGIGAVLASGLLWVMRMINKELAVEVRALKALVHRNIERDQDDHDRIGRLESDVGHIRRDLSGHIEREERSEERWQQRIEEISRQNAEIYLELKSLRASSNH